MRIIAIISGIIILLLGLLCGYLSITKHIHDLVLNGTALGWTIGGVFIIISSISGRYDS